MKTRSIIVATTAFAAALCAATSGLKAQTLELALNEQAAADRAAASSQERINKLNDESQEMLAKYRQALVDAESFRKYGEQIGAQVASQDEEIANLKRQLGEIEVVARDVLPLMVKMVDTLEEFVKLDLPFLVEERAKRVATLKSLMPRADVTISEKYRRILEAYEIEMEYGRTLEAYDGKLEAGSGEPKTVEFVRLGRVSLMYRTSDGKETGYWDVDQKKWVVDNSYAHAVKEAMRVAKKQGAPDLLFAPVPAPKKVSP